MFRSIGWFRIAAAGVAMLAVALLTGNASQPSISNPDTLVVANANGPNSLDPAWQYDTLSAEIVFNVYETLVFHGADDPDELVPQLATRVPSRENGLIRINEQDRMTVTFPIRRGVRFHKGGVLTPADVAYSLRRGLLQDRSGGPQWLLLQPLLGVSSIDQLADEQGDEAACRQVKDAVQVDDNARSVTLTLAEPFEPILRILARSWASIVDKEWVTNQGGWDGSCDTWRQHHDPSQEASVLYQRMNGTGPFQFERWSKAKGEVLLSRFEDYWKGQASCEQRYGPDVCTGVANVQRVLIDSVSEWSARKLRLQKGDADFAHVPRQFTDTLKSSVKERDDSGDADYGQLETVNPDGHLRLFTNLLRDHMLLLLFNQQIRPNSPFLGSGQLDGNGVPPDFFADVHVRKCFAYAFDYQAFIKDVFKGEGIRPRGLIPKGMLGHNPDRPVYTHDLDQAEAQCRQAWDGRLWENGFTMTVPHVPSNPASRTVVNILSENLASIHSGFDLQPRGLATPAYFQNLSAGRIGLMMMGWQQDYHDPHAWVFPFLHSRGNFARLQRFPNQLQQRLDRLVEQGRAQLDRDARASTYRQLQQLVHDRALNLFLIQDMARHYEQTWIRGWNYNPNHPGAYFYPISKGTD